MKIYLSILLFSFNFNPLFSQENPILETYYQSLYTAEDHILLSNYDSAVYYYEKAFAMFPENFIPDLNNALICAIESDKYELTGKYIKELLKQGVPKSFFEKKYYYKQFVGSEVFVALDEVVDSGLDSFKIKLIDSLLIIDQYPRVNNLLDSILGVDEKNEKILEAQIFEKGLLPTAYEIGVEIHNDTIVRSSRLDILLIHQMRNIPEKYREFYRENLQHKRISPIQYFSKANLFTERTDEEILGCEERTFAIIQYIEEEGFTCCCKLKERADRNRKKIYLEDIDRAIRKYRFIKKSTLPFIMNKQLNATWSYTDEQKKQDALDKLKADPEIVKFIEE